MSALTIVDIGEHGLDRFAEVLSDEQYAQVRDAVGEAQELFEGRVIWHVNSTARGGGVAEMLTPLLPYACGSGVDARWAVIDGDEGFFEVTKRVHNRLHGVEGDGGPLGDEQRSSYLAALEASADALCDAVEGRDVVVLHDPQTAGLIPRLKASGATVIWRCHIGLDTPNDIARDAWAFLREWVQQADACLFSREQFIWEDLDRDRVHVIAPTIDAFAPKNQELSGEVVAAILATAGLVEAEADAVPEFERQDGSKARVERAATTIEDSRLQPGDAYVLQVSRWDALKDPIGVLDGFVEHVAPHTDAHLVYAGPEVEAVSDDPEGAQVLEQAKARFEAMDAETRAHVHLVLLPMEDLEENAVIVNALQRGASIVVQKSLAEGFGLTVAEAMWKSRPVVASRIGGIQDQIEDGRSGVLLDDPEDLEAYGKALLELLEDPDRAREMGERAHDRVRGRFLGSQSLLEYLAVVRHVLEGDPQAAPSAD
ncbi:MAG TPA: glycosyltransferase [Solirubrobacteraceae bacterium]|nr:glycosyltransferase [Solirubrobacteraceae bacterium]